MKLRVKLTRSNTTKQVVFTTSRNGNTVLTGTCVGADDYQLNLLNGGYVDVSELAVGLTVNIVFHHSSAEAAAGDVALAYSKYGNGPFIVMVVECRTKKPAAGGNIIIMEEDIISIDYETYESDTTITNEDELNALFKKGAGASVAPLMGGSRAASEASAPGVGAPSCFNRKVILQERI